MKVISIINEKGGVGKSTTSLALFSSLCSRGYKTLSLDMDPQGNFTYALGGDVNEGVSRLLTSPEKIEDEIQHLIPSGDLISSNRTLSAADVVLTDVGKEYKIKEALEHVKNLYDFVVVDTPPSLGILTVNALTSSDYVIIPTQADIYSMQGVNKLYSTINTVKKYCNPNLEVLGILITRWNGRATIRKVIAESLSGMAKELNTHIYETKIRECIALVEAVAKRKDIFSYAPKSNASLDYTGFVDEVLVDIKRKG